MTSMEKESKHNVELHDVAPAKGIDGVAVERDAFGARKKIDPVEIRLVRKLDCYIMVSSLLI